MKNVFGKKFLKSCKDHKKLQHYRAMVNISWPHFFTKKASEKNGITFSAIKRERLIFVKNVFGKKFLKSCKDHKKLQHYRAMVNISWPHFFTKKASEKNGITFSAIKRERLIFVSENTFKMIQ